MKARLKNVVTVEQFTSPDSALVFSVTLTAGETPVAVNNTDWIINDNGTLSVLSDADFKAKYDLIPDVSSS